MNRFLIICDRSMFGALLVMILFLPYSLAMIEICQITMMVAWAAKRFGSGRGFGPAVGWGLRFPSSGMGWPLVAIGLLILLTIPFSHYPALSLKKLFSRYLQQIFIMYCVAEIIRNRQRLYRVLAVLLLMGLIVSVQALSQYVWGQNLIHHSELIFGRVSGPMHHPNDLGTLLVTLIPATLVLMITGCSWFSSLFRFPDIFVGKMPWIRWVLLAFFLILVMTLGLTSSRGAWVAFTVTMIALGFCLKGRRSIVFIILMLTMFLWVFGMYCLGTRMDLYTTSMHQEPVIKPSFTNPWGLPVQYSAMKLLTGSSGRELYWDTAVGVIKKYPWFGCGYSAYVQTLKDLQVGHTEYPHDSLLHITAELGVVGLMLYSWLFIALCLQIKKVLRAVSSEHDLFLLGCGVSCGIFAWLIHSLMDTPWSSLQLNILLWSLIGILLSLGHISPKQGEKSCL